MSTSNEHLSILSKMLNLEQARELVSMIKLNQPVINEIPEAKLLEKIEVSLLPQKEATPEQLAKRADILKDGVPQTDLLAVVIGSETFYAQKSLFSNMKGTVFNQASSNFVCFPNKNPKNFRVILQLLKGETKKYMKLDRDAKTVVKEDIQFYGLFELINNYTVHSIQALRELDPHLCTSTITSSKRFLRNQDRCDNWENSYGSDDSNPWLQLEFEKSMCAISSGSLGLSSGDSEQNIFRVSLLAGFIDANSEGTPFDGITPSPGIIKKWVLVAQADSEKSIEGELKFNMVERPVIASIFRIQFSRFEGRRVRLKLYNLTLLGASATWLI